MIKQIKTTWRPLLKLTEVVIDKDTGAVTETGNEFHLNVLNVPLIMSNPQWTALIYDNCTVLVKESAKDKVEKWCESIDDDIFVEACEKFEELTGKSLNEADESKLYNLFQAVVQQVVSAKIDKLKKLYNLGD